MLRIKIVLLAVVLILGGFFTAAPRNSCQLRINRRPSIAAVAQKHICQSPNPDSSPVLDWASLTSTSFDPAWFAPALEAHGLVLPRSLLRLLCSLRI